MNNKILVTGAGGFIGSHLVEELLNNGYSVKAFIRYNSKNNWGWIEDIPNYENLEIVTGDIRDFDSVLNAIKDCKSVFHLAALIGIPYSYISPLAYIKTNIEGTYNVLEAAKKMKLDNVVITSSSEVYGTAKYVPIDEKHPLAGQSPYSATKISADEIALSYIRSFDLPVKIIRPFNTYGPRQSARAIIPSIIIQLLNKEKKINLGNINPVRDLTYIHDTVKGFIKVFKSNELFGQVVNVGSGKGISIKDLFHNICSLMDVKADVKIANERIRPHKSEVMNLICNNSKLIKMTNWVNAYNIDIGLLKTIEWIREHKMYYKNIYNK